MASAAERMAATRARRRAGLVQFVITLPIAEREKIVRLGYEGVAADDQRGAGEALRLFIADTLAARSARVTALRRATPFQ